MLIVGLVLTGALACARSLPHRGEEARPGVATVHAGAIETKDAGAQPAPTVKGEPYRKTQGDLAVYVPDEVAVHEGRFDLVVHFHGNAKLQEANVEEADLHAVVVSVNEGEGSTSYSRKFTGERALDRVTEFAEKELAASGRVSGQVQVGRIALSSWSAGGAAVHRILETQPERVDAVLVADGIFSTYADPGKREVNTKPLEPIVQFARLAADGKKLFVLTHTDIDPSQYPSVKECTDVVLGALALEKGAPPAAAPPAGGNPMYATDRGELHVRGFDGKGPQDHIAQIKALDDAYGMLKKRWSR